MGKRIRTIEQPCQICKGKGQRREALKFGVGLFALLAAVFLFVTARQEHRSTGRIPWLQYAMTAVFALWASRDLGTAKCDACKGTGVQQTVERVED
jgi:hypothetical protein